MRGEGDERYLFLWRAGTLAVSVLSRFPTVDEREREREEDSLENREKRVENGGFGLHPLVERRNA